MLRSPSDVNRTVDAVTIATGARVSHVAPVAQSTPFKPKLYHTDSADVDGAVAAVDDPGGSVLTTQKSMLFATMTIIAGVDWGSL